MMYNGPAYPTQGGSTGVDLVGYFAAHALIGLLSNPVYAQNADNEKYVKVAYDIALLMVKEYNK